ncbi:hypothetical protein BD413DRAFT_579958, partial [Trametes elegans]
MPPCVVLSVLVEGLETLLGCCARACYAGLLPRGARFAEASVSVVGLAGRGGDRVSTASVGVVPALAVQLRWAWDSSTARTWAGVSGILACNGLRGRLKELRPRPRALSSGVLAADRYCTRAGAPIRTRTASESGRVHPAAGV